MQNVNDITTLFNKVGSVDVQEPSIKSLNRCGVNND